MKVKDLIRALQKHDPNSDVMMQTGFLNTPITALTTLPVRLDKRCKEPVVCSAKGGKDPVTFLSHGSGVFVLDDGALYDDPIEEGWPCDF